MSELGELLAEARDDPGAFVRIVLKAEPRRWQERVLGEIAGRLARGERHLEVLVRSCHGAGKTALAGMLTIWWTSTRPGSRGLTTAPTWIGVEHLLWREIARLYEGSLLAKAGVGRLLSTSLTFGPMWDCVGASSDRPENLEGRHGASAIRVVDEAKAVEEGVLTATEGLLDAEESLDVWISTPSRASGPFYQRDVRGGPRVIRNIVTIDNLIAEGLPGKEAWKARRLEQWGEQSPDYQSRALARYVSDAEGALFPFAWVERAQAATFVVPGAPVVGLDVAGSVAGDASSAAVVVGPDRLGRYQVRCSTEWHEQDTMISKGKALLIVREAGADELRVDAVGLGQGVADAIRQDFPRTVAFRATDRSRDPERFQNLKAEVAWAFRELLERGLVRLPDDAELKAQLVAMCYEITTQGRIRVVDPSDSPDRVDAVLIALSGVVGRIALSLDDIGGDAQTNPFSDSATMDKLALWASPSRPREDAF